MLSNRLKSRIIVALGVALLASFVPVSPAPAGPISDMIARHRQNRAMKLPPMDKPFSTKPVKDLNARTASLSERFKKRFSFKRNGSSNSDQGVIKASH